MAQYIDKQELIKFLDERGYFKHAIYKSVIEDFPTADVVPKSEVEKWFRECEELQGRMIELEKEVAREIFEEIEDVLNNIGYFDEIDFKALKNKYTESEGERYKYAERNRCNE